MDYARHNLEQYVRQTADSAIAELLAQWPQVSAAHARDEFDRGEAYVPIHGDYHTGHIYYHRQDPRRIKLIDWEWAGMGRAHFDLATLLQRHEPDEEALALEAYAQGDRRLSLDEHRRRYEWCQLERGLLNAAYLARQQMESQRRSRWVPEFIADSARRVLRAQRALRVGNG
jgi:thiamine kinase-like enzyme